MAIAMIEDLESERDSKPFEIEFKDGTVFTFKDPKDVDLNALNSPSPFDQMKAMMNDGDFEALLARPEVDVYYLIGLVGRYRDSLTSTPV